MVNFGLRNFATERLVISDLNLKDAFEMENWGVHKSPVYSAYNFDDMSKKERIEWYHFKTDSRRNHYYSVRERGVLIGYFGIKDISRFFKYSTLGIVIDENRMGEGFGTEILTNYLDLYFNRFKMRKMKLKVAKFNKRAIKLYKSMGFKETGYSLEKLLREERDLAFLREYPEYFEVSGSEILYYSMNMEKVK